MLKPANKFLRSIIVLSFILIPSYVSAATYYVDTTLGNNTNNGTSTTTPWQTLVKVNGTTFTPGDNIYFKRGEIFTGNLVVGQSGTIGNPITFGAYGTGARPIIEATGNNHGFDIRTNKSYININGIEVRNATQNQFLMFSSVSNVNITDSAAFGGSGAGFNILGPGTFSNISIADSRATGYSGATAAGIKLGSGTTFDTITVNNFTATSSSGQHGFTVGAGTYSNISINNSYFANHTSSGINFNPGTSTQVMIQNSTSTLNSGYGIYLAGYKDQITINNVVSTFNTLSGAAFDSGVGSTINNVAINNSIFNNNTSRGIVFVNRANNVTINNSTTSNNGAAGILLQVGGTGFTLTGVEANSNTLDGLTLSVPSGTTLGGTLIENSILNGNGSNGLTLTGNGTGTSPTVTYSTASNNGNDGFNIHNNWTGIMFDHDTANSNGIDGLNADGDGFSFHEMSAGTIRNSIAKDNKKSAVTNINTTNTIIYNNIFTHTASGTNALARFYDGGTHVLYHNVFYNPSHEGTAMSGEATTTIDFKNNIINGFNIGIQKLGSSAITEDYNLIFGANTNWSSITQGEHSIVSDPKFVNSTSNNFSLLPSSPAINKGVTSLYLTDYLGNARYGHPDIGAYEYQGEPEAPLVLIPPVTVAPLTSRGGFSSMMTYATNPTIPFPITTSSTPYIFTRNLTMNSKGEDVRQLQIYLNTHGFPVAPANAGAAGQETTFFGNLTRIALSKFQTAKKIFPTAGYFGPITRKQIHES